MKTAERMIIDMRDRIDLSGVGAIDSNLTGVTAVPDNPVQDAIGALIALGYRPADASKAVNAVKDQSQKRDDLIKNALKHITSR